MTELDSRVIVTPTRKETTLCRQVPLKCCGQTKRKMQKCRQPDLVTV